MIKFFTMLVVALGIAGCAGITPVTPETPREKLVTAEAAYEFAMLEVRSLILTGIIEPGSSLSDALTLLIVETRAALDAWQSMPDNPNLAVTAQAVLVRLQAEVARLIKTQETSWIGDPGSEGVMA